MDVPVVFVTHNLDTIAQEWFEEGSPFTFVTDDVASSIEQAKTIAGEKNVAVASTTIVQQCLKAGLLDEIHIDLVPVPLGEGIRLFDHLNDEFKLVATEASATP